MKQGVKKMPNHEPVVLMCRILSHETGQNRAARRQNKVFDKKINKIKTNK